MSDIRRPLIDTTRETLLLKYPATAAVSAALPSSPQCISLTGTSFRRCSRIASPNVLATMPRSEAITSPTIESRWNNAEYTGKDATVMTVAAIMGVSVSPAA